MGNDDRIEWSKNQNDYALFDSKGKSPVPLERNGGATIAATFELSFCILMFSALLLKY